MLDLLTLVVGTAFALSEPAHRFEPMSRAPLTFDRTAARTAVLVARVRAGKTPNPRRQRSGLQSERPRPEAPTLVVDAGATWTSALVWAQRRPSPPRGPPSPKL